MNHLRDGFYWTQLNDTSDWEPTKLDGDRWTLIGDSYETYSTDQLYAIGPRVGYETSLAVAQADFLCRRLGELDWSQDRDDVARDFMGHVEPAAERLEHTLKIVDKQGPVARQPLTDVQQLTHLKTLLVNAVVPIAEAEPVDGDFSVLLEIKRTAGKALVDAILIIPTRNTR